MLSGRLRWCAALLAAAVLVCCGTGPASAVGEVDGGTFVAPVALPIGIPGSFVATNVNAPPSPTSPNAPFSQHTTWFEFTATSSGPVSIAARAAPGWDPKLQLNEAGGTWVTGADDTIGRDPVIAPVLTAGVTYRLGLGGYGPADVGSATITTTTQVPDAPTGLVATAGDTTASLSWTAAVEHGTPALDQTVQCARDGGAWTTCAAVPRLTNGTRPTSATVTGLTNGSSYRFRVLAGSVLGDTAPSVVVPAPGGLVPAAASALTATAAPSVRGTGTTLQVGVTSHGAAVTGGTVTVDDTGAVLGSAPVSGGAAAVLVDPPVGTRTLTVTYAGIPGVAPSSTAVPVTSTAAAQVLDPRWPAYAGAGTSLVLDTRSSAGLPVQLTVAGPCAVTGDRLTALTPGRCTVTATATGDADHLPATPVSRDVVVLPAFAADLELDAAPGERLGSARVVATAVGLAPGSAVVVELHSTPVQLATAVAGPDGAVSVDTTLPAAIPAGRHEVVLLGTTPDGTSARTALALSVTSGGRLAPVGDGPQLAVTGAPVSEVAVVAFALLTGGGALVAAGRRRRA